MRFDEFDQYSENLLMAQYDVSEIISHELMKTASVAARLRRDQ